MTTDVRPQLGSHSICKNCRKQIVFHTFIGAGFYEPDAEDAPAVWRHMTDGYSSCWQNGTRAEPWERYVYVASSWRNDVQPEVCSALFLRGVPHYDFKRPNGDPDGFHWSQVMDNYQRGGEAVGQKAPVDEYIRALQHPRAIEGFHKDWDAMQRADTCVLILPCNRSAHLELGWFVGQGRRTAILLDGDFVTPELMYKMVDFMTSDITSLIRWIEEGDES